jgi:hypothetical protein
MLVASREAAPTALSLDASCSAWNKTYRVDIRRVAEGQWASVNDFEPESF